MRLSEEVQCLKCGSSTTITGMPSMLINVKDASFHKVPSIACLNPTSGTTYYELMKMLAKLGHPLANKKNKFVRITKS